MSEAKKCPSCGGVLMTVDSRACASPDVLIRRRVRCKSCGARFTTHETIVGDMAVSASLMGIVAAHDRAVEALGTALSGIDPEELSAIRRSLGQIRRFV